MTDKQERQFLVANIKSAPKCLNTNDKAMWVTGWNDCLEALAAPPAQPAPAQRLSDARIMQIWDKHAAMAPAGSRRLAVGRAIEAAIVPPGYCVVPVCPTEAMQDAGYAELVPTVEMPHVIYSAMIAAAKDKP